MADLTNTLSTDMFTKPVRAADVSNSALTGAVGRLGGFIDTLSDKSRQRAQENRQAQADAEKKSKADAENAAARSLVDTNALFRGEGPGPTVLGEPTTDVEGSSDPSSPLFNMAGAAPDETALASQKSTERLQSIKAAVDQGRMPQISYNAAVFKEMQRLMSSHPGQESVIMDTFRQNGFQNAYTQMFADEQKVHEENRDAAINLDNKAFEKAMTGLSPEERAGMSREQLIGVGYDKLSAESKLTWAQQNYTYSQQINNAAKTEAQTLLSNTLITQTWEDTRNITNMLSKASDAVMKLPVGQQAKAWEELGVKAMQYIDSYTSLISAKAAGSNLPPEEYNKIKERVEGISSQYKSFFTGDSSVYQSRIKSYTTFMNSAKLNVADAAPLYWSLKQLGVSDTTLEVFGNSIAADPKLQQKLADEASGYSSRFSGDLGSSTIINVVKMLSGQTSLKDMSFDAARSAMPTLNRTAKSITAAYNNGTHENPNEVLNAIGQMVIASDTINPSSDVNTSLIATDGFANAATRRALKQLIKDPQLNDVAEATVIGSRAASMQLIQSNITRIGKLNASSPAHKIIFDNRQGTYKIQTDKKFTGKLSGVDQAVLMDPMTGAGAPMTRTPPPVSKEMTATVNLLNANILNAVDLASVDPSAPKGASANDLFRFYGSGGKIVPDSVKQVKKQGDTNMGENVEEILGTLEAEFKRMGDQVTGTGVASPTGPLPSATEVRNQFRGNPNVDVVASAAQKYNIPEDLALRLAKQESSFNHNTGMNSAGAIGLMQITTGGKGAPWDKAAMTRYGKKRNELTPQENADLGMWILAQNYKSTGNWRDAVSMYHSGVDFQTAARQGRNDGNMDTVDYVRGIAG